MNTRLYTSLFLLVAVSVASWAGTLRWAAEWTDDDAVYFDRVVIGRVTDASASPVDSDGLYIGYADSQVSAIIRFPELDEYQSSDTVISDLEAFPEYNYYMELYAGNDIVAYTDLYTQSRLTFALVENGAHEPWDVSSFHSAAPEPTSGLLLLIGGGLLGLRRRKRRIA